MDDDDENDDDSSDGTFDPPAVDDAAIVFSGHAKSVFAVAVDPTGSVAVSGGEDDKAFVWKVVDGSVLFECKGHEVKNDERARPCLRACVCARAYIALFYSERSGDI